MQLFRIFADKDRKFIQIKIKPTLRLILVKIMRIKNNRPSQGQIIKKHTGIVSDQNVYNRQKLCNIDPCIQHMDSETFKIYPRLDDMMPTKYYIDRVIGQLPDSSLKV